MLNHNARHQTFQVSYGTISKNVKRHNFQSDWQYYFPIAIFGVLASWSASADNGLLTAAIGIDGVTECANTPKLPSTDILRSNTIVYMGGAVYSFGGLVDGSTFQGSAGAYKFDLATDKWTQISSLNHPRTKPSAIQISDSEILIAGCYAVFLYLLYKKYI